MSYQRDQELRMRINEFIEAAFQLPSDDYYQRMDLNTLLSLKAALSDVNNAITTRLTLSFVEWASQALKIDEVTAIKLRSAVLSAKPSSNGYDVHHLGQPPFVAEVKCNVPVNGGAVYGRAQRDGIIKDIKQLVQGKTKALPLTPNTLKFMVFLDLPQVRAANEQLIRTASEVSSALRFDAFEKTPNNPDIVYGVYVKVVA